MPRTLHDELHQRKPFASPHEEAALNLVRTTNVLTDAMDLLLKPHGLSATQYNVLRILRGAEPAGLCRNELRDRMLTRMPDVTRLLDRMEQAGLVLRSREEEDRRMVLTRITKAGRKLVDSLDGPVGKVNHQELGHLSAAQLRTLIELCTAVRNRP